MTKIISNITIIMNDGARSPEPCKFTITDSGLIERTKYHLARAVEWRNSVIGASSDHLKQAHEEVMTLRSVLADLESGA